MSPRIARWITDTFSISAFPLRDVGLRDASDLEIFHAARKADSIVMTKDIDFVDLVERLGVPPRILWITCGNTSEAALKSMLSVHLTTALQLIGSGESVVEIA